MVQPEVVGHRTQWVTSLLRIPVVDAGDRRADELVWRRARYHGPPGTGKLCRLSYGVPSYSR